MVTSTQPNGTYIPCNIDILFKKLLVKYVMAIGGLPHSYRVEFLASYEYIPVQWNRLIHIPVYIYIYMIYFD